MRILIISQYYKPEPVPKPSELAESLNEKGYQVSVVTGLPNYPLGKIYSGYRSALLQKEILDKIRIIRTYLFAYHGKRPVGRILNYVTFMLSAPLSLLFAPKADIIYVFHPPLTVGLIAFVISKVRGIPFVYDVQDIWPESAVVAGFIKPGRLVWLLSRIERFVYARAEHIFVITEGAKTNLSNKGVPPQKISILPHWLKDNFFVADASALRSRIRAHYGWENNFIVLFAGNIGLVQGLEIIIHASERLNAADRVKFVIVGEGVAKEALQQTVSSRQLQTFVQFIDHQAVDKMPEIFVAADVLMVHLKKSALCDYVIPTKTIAYLSVGKPILAAIAGAAAELIEAAGAGITVPPGDPDAFVEAVRCLASLDPGTLEQMGANGRSYYLEHFIVEKVIPQYEDQFRDVLGRRSRNGRPQNTQTHKLNSA